MSSVALPDFERTLALSQGNVDAATLAECHGIACGLLVRQPDSQPDSFLGLLDMLEVVQPQGALRSALIELLQVSSKQLADDDMSLVIWLPNDEEMLEDRTEALAQWCNGFLAAIGSGNDGRLETLSGEAAESLADIQEIAMAEMAEASDVSDAQAEEEEEAFVEIVEYIRVATLILREDLRGPQARDSIH